MEETVLTSDQSIIDADCKQDLVIMLVKGNGENVVLINGNVIMKLAPGYHMVRFAKDHFCLLNHSTLSFYTLSGEIVSSADAGKHIHEIFPFKDGVLCTYGDQGIYGQGRGTNLINYISPCGQITSFQDTAVCNQLDYNLMLARFKPCAALNQSTNELIFFNEQLENLRSITVPFETGNVIAFALTYQFVLFIQENQLYKWEFQKNGEFIELPEKFSYRTRALFHRHEFLFLEISDRSIRMFMRS